MFEGVETDIRLMKEELKESSTKGDIFDAAEELIESNANHQNRIKIC